MPNSYTSVLPTASARCSERSRLEGKRIRLIRASARLKPHGVSFGYGWTLNPAAKTMLEMPLKAPEDPASKNPNTLVLDEPVSKQGCDHGVLEWRRQTWPVITGHPCKDSHAIFYRGTWTGYVGNKLISIAVDDLYDSKDTGQAWIDEYIGKLTGALGSK
jgi:hypothetical protein